MLITIRCKNCNKEFEAYKSNHRKFCCKECLNEYQRGKPGNRKKTGIYKKCLVCNNNFYIPKWRLKGNPKYCSRKCSGEAKKGVIISSKIIECKICGKRFTRFPYQEKIKRGLYCSKKCAKVGISLTLTGRKQSEYTKNKRADSNRGKKRSIKFRLSRSGNKCHLWKGGIWKKNRREYDKYSHTAEWKYWRREVFERDNYTCQDCNERGGKLEPHHIIPMRKIIKNNLINLIYDVSNGMTLCRKCHKKTFKRK